MAVWFLQYTLDLAKFGLMTGFHDTSKSTGTVVNDLWFVYHHKCSFNKTSQLLKKLLGRPCHWDLAIRLGRPVSISKRLGPPTRAQVKVAVFDIAEPVAQIAAEAFHFGGWGPCGAESHSC